MPKYQIFFHTALLVNQPLFDTEPCVGLDKGQ